MKKLKLIYGKDYGYNKKYGMEIIPIFEYIYGVAGIGLVVLAPIKPELTMLMPWDGIQPSTVPKYIDQEYKRKKWKT